MKTQPSRLRELHALSTQNKDSLARERLAGCFYCLRLSGPEDIKEWIDKGETALCPFCSVDSLLPGVFLEETLKDMKKYWFESKGRKYAAMGKDKKFRTVVQAEIHEEDGLDLAQLQRESHENAANKGFWDEKDGQKPDVGAKMMLICCEVAEAMEEYRKGKPLDHVYFVDGKPEGFGVELADAIIRIADLAEYAKVDLSSLIKLKARFNLSRPKMHGKKV